MNPEIDEQGRADEGIERGKCELSDQTLDGLRSRLERVETIKSRGVATDSIAFELRQSLCGIVTNANACLRMLAADPPKFESARETMRRAIRDGNRALEAVATLEALERQGAPTGSAVLNEGTREGACPFVE